MTNLKLWTKPTIEVTELRLAKNGGPVATVDATRRQHSS